ncbi:ABC transporter ATP-binding protein [Caloranaerobacter azorensis]|uniref:Lipopolysaccharide transport system ATP-binding protein n=2 Tax=Caloranaerobacter azorensis TaxID=116090 RepID=A0A1M5SZW1_9FIRM|nr:ABC transporter ATP-binding protein [Caloranaerobacter azorensis]QIB27582.1 ABC transporter ATP-binding protein [Caloranaerobacter azorensis]SHH44006.1 lipopolysaccharide transport system ATP-binding protein [Caloranaerobacter azorensis DSM 13643]
MSQIILKDIKLVYQIKKEKRIKDIFIKSRHTLNNSLLANNKILALKNINLELRDGDRLGIIGHNGAGKSSLLKLIAGIYPPTSGQIQVDGRIATLFELATGFEMEATGWDNIYLRGLMLGETPDSIKQKADEIAEFSELGEYLNIPVKYYSSGMFMRLAFSISTAIEPDILLLDEVVAAGDASFLNKAKKRMRELMDSVKILVFVTHDMISLKDFCNKCIWLENGHIKMEGSPDEVSHKYLSSIGLG